LSFLALGYGTFKEIFLGTTPKENAEIGVKKNPFKKISGILSFIFSDGTCASVTECCTPF